MFREAIGDAVPLKPTGRATRRRCRRRRTRASASSTSARRSPRRSPTRSTSSGCSTPTKSCPSAAHGVGPDVLRALRRGHWVVQDQIDLHGLRVDEAREALAAFLGRALSAASSAACA